MRYSAYGVCIVSEFPLIGLPIASDERDAVSIERGDFRLLREKDTENLLQHEIFTMYWGDNPTLCIEEIGEFQLRPSESKICLSPAACVSSELMRYWLMHLILPFYLLLNRRLDFLHGSAVEVEGGAIAFLADSMGGKSTLAAHFCQQGHSLLTDEYLGIREEEGFVVVPSVPFVRPYRQIADLGYQVDRFALRPLPLRAVYVIVLGADSPNIVPLTGALAALMVSRHGRFRFASRARERFSRFAALAASVPVRELRAPRDASRLDEVYATILADIGGRGDKI